MSQNKCKHILTLLICISLFVIFSGCGNGDSTDDLLGHWKVTDTKLDTSYDIYLTGDSFTQVFNGLETTFSYKIVNNGEENLRMELNNEDGNITYLDLAYKNKDRTVIEASTDLKEGKYSKQLTEAIANMESLGMETVSKANWNYIDDKQKP